MKVIVSWTAPQKANSSSNVSNARDVNRPVSLQSTDDLSVVKKRFNKLISMYKNQSDILKHALRRGGAVYGSLLWRIFQCMEVCNDNKMALQKMLCKIAAEKSDVDLLLPNTVVVDEFIQYDINCHIYEEDDSALAASIRTVTANDYWLTYPMQNREDARCARAIQSVFHSSGANIGAAMDEIRKISTDSTLNTNITASTYDCVVVSRIDDYHKLHIAHQIHFISTPKCFKYENVSMSRLLTDAIAPFLSVESFVYSFDGGLESRFYPLAAALEDLKNKQMRIINAEEFIRHITNEPGSVSTFKHRLMKYASYGFELRISAEDLQFSKIATIIQSLHTLHVNALTDEQKSHIALMQKYDVMVTSDDGDDIDEMGNRMQLECGNRDDALCAQSLYLDYISSCVRVVTPLIGNVAKIVTEYAARTNERVFYNDLKIRVKIEKLENKMAELRKQLQV